MKRSDSATDLAHALGDAAIGVEARALRDDHLTLKVWLRLLASSTQIETMIRKRLRTRFGMSLARFDYLAQLHRHRDGIRMNALSRYLMVTGGNVTGLTDELEKEGFVTRESDPSDRRSFIVKLTREGRRSFERIAAEHEQWVIELFEGVPAADLQRLYDTLGRLRLALNETANPTTDGAAP
jgi:DNA-binding MarR family transcriptional regulator